MFCTFGTTIFSVFIPRVNRFVVQNDKHQELNELFIKVGRIQFEVIMLIFTGFVLLGKPFIKIWGGHGYEQSYYVALILLSAVIPSQIQNLGIQIQMAMNKHKFRSVCYFLIAIFNVIISIPLCIKYGPVGSATGTAIALVLGTWIVMNIYYHKKIKLNIFKFWKSILSIVTGILIAFAIGYAITKFYKPVSIFQIIVIGLTYVVVYAISLFLFSMNQYEKEIVYSIFKKFIIIVR